MAAPNAKEGAVVDTDTLIVRRDRVLVQHVPGAILIVGYGRRANALRHFACSEPVKDVDPFIARCERVAQDVESNMLAKGWRTGSPGTIIKIADRVLRRIAIAEALAKAGFNPDEPRDERGRWTTDGGSDAARRAPASTGHALSSPTMTSASAAAAGVARGTAWEFGGDLTPEVFGDLALLAMRFSAPTVFLGTLFIPTPIGRRSTGNIQGRPDLSFDYDGDTGNLTLSRDGTAFVASQNIYGLFRDNQGHVIGRFVEGHIVFDADALPAPSRAAAHADPSLVGTDEDRIQSKVCPATVPENIKGRSQRTIAYQAQITQLPPGLAVEVPDPVTGTPVQFDGCCTPYNAHCVRDGVVLDYLLEAKGEGFADKMIDSSTWQKWYRGRLEIENQMRKQDTVAGAAGWDVEWNFGEAGPATFFAEYADRKDLLHTHVRYTPLRRP